MEPFGALWSPMDPYGALWINQTLWSPMEHMEPYGAQWIPLEPYGALWINQTLWSPRAPQGSPIVLGCSVGGGCAADTEGKRNTFCFPRSFWGAPSWGYTQRPALYLYRAVAQSNCACLPIPVIFIYGTTIHSCLGSNHFD